MYRTMHEWFQQAKREDARNWVAQRGARSIETRASEGVA
jgi:hypothetical protein